MSLPSWECGLKSVIQVGLQTIWTSLPSWECGLKLPQGKTKKAKPGVAPFVGVWIEIPEYPSGALPVMSLPSWECGLK